jgi:cytidine deaminase
MQNLSRVNGQDLELIEIAKKHSKKCYRKNITSMAAVLRAKSGSFFTGVNVKYKKVWKCICAERVAIAKAVEAGETEFDSIVTVKYLPEEDGFLVVNMCGECRQVSLFHSPLKVISADNGEVASVQIEELFPYPYS